METLTHAAAKGADLLDEDRPGWATMIDLDTLDVSDLANCPLGQVYGQFTSSLYRLGIDPSLASEFGFDLSGRSSREEEDEQFTHLTRAWTEEILSRR